MIFIEKPRWYYQRGFVLVKGWNSENELQNNFCIPMPTHLNLTSYIQ
jgi:hypothetical protein